MNIRGRSIIIDTRLPTKGVIVYINKCIQRIMSKNYLKKWKTQQWNLIIIWQIFGVPFKYLSLVRHYAISPLFSRGENDRLAHSRKWGRFNQLQCCFVSILVTVHYCPLGCFTKTLFFLEIQDPQILIIWILSQWVNRNWCQKMRFPQFVSFP